MAQFKSLAEALGAKRASEMEKLQENIIEPEKEAGFFDLLIDFEDNVRVHNTISGKINNLRQQITDMRASFGPDLDKNQDAEESTDLTHPRVSGERRARAMAAHNNLVEDYHDQTSLLSEKEETITDLLNKLLEKAKSKDEMKQLFDYIHKSDDLILKDKLLNLETRKRVKENLLRIKSEKDTSSVATEPIPNDKEDRPLNYNLPKLDTRSSLVPNLSNNSDNDSEIRKFRDDRKPGIVDAEGGATSKELNEAINDERPMERADSIDGLAVPEGGNKNFNYGFGTPVKQVAVNESANVLAENENNEDVNLIQNIKLPSNELVAVGDALPDTKPISADTKSDDSPMEKKPELESRKPVVMKMFSPNGDARDLEKRLSETGSVEPAPNSVAAIDSLADTRRKDIEDENVGSASSQSSSLKRIEDIKSQFLSGNKEEVVSSEESVETPIFANDVAKTTTEEDLSKVVKPEPVSAPIVEDTVKTLLEKTPEQAVLSNNAIAAPIPVESQSAEQPVVDNAQIEAQKEIEPTPQAIAAAPTPEAPVVGEVQTVNTQMVSPVLSSEPLVSNATTAPITQSKTAEEKVLTKNQIEESRVGKKSKLINWLLKKKEPTAADAAKLTTPEAPSK